MDANTVIDGLKYWGPVVGAVSLVWKAVGYFTGLGAKLDRIESNHLTHIEADMAKLPGIIEEQTKELVAELRRIRTDESIDRLNQSIEALPGSMPVPAAPTQWVSSVVSELREIGENIRAVTPSDDTLRECFKLQTETLVRELKQAPAVITAPVIVPPIGPAIEAQTRELKEAWAKMPGPAPTPPVTVNRIDAPPEMTDTLAQLLTEIKQLRQDQQDSRGRAR